MDIIVISHRRGRTWKFALNPRHVLVWLPVALVMSALVAGSFKVGQMFGSARGGQTLRVETSAPVALVAHWAGQVQQQREELNAARTDAEHNATAMARRIAQLQAHVMRLDAVGSRLTEMAGLDAGEFSFNQDPAIGGPESGAADGGSAQVFASLNNFERQLADRERQLRVLEDLLLASRLQQEVKPSGWPIASGFISSLFGLRTDPFSGKLARHMGMDFAGREGSDVLSVAAGIVSEAGPRHGYGNLVEINHGNGYTTRYGHNKSVLVNVGDKVSKGERIALMGSTGRSTGPHVHFEVLYNGQLVNPAQYIRASR